MVSALKYRLTLRAALNAVSPALLISLSHGNATRDLHVVADVLGHASVNTSAIYAKMDVSVRREALAAAEVLGDVEM